MSVFLLLFPLYVHLVLRKGINLPSAVIRLNGQIAAKAPVYKHEQFYLCRTPEGIYGRERCADAPARIKNIVYKYDVFALDQKIDPGAVGFERAGLSSEIVPEKRNVQKPHLKVLNAVVRFEKRFKPLRQKYAPRLQTNKNGVFKIEVFFDELAREPVQDDIDFFFCKQYFRAHTSDKSSA